VQVPGFDLERFVTAQAPVWPAVRAELRAARKQSHWMWFVFPQLAMLGRSDMARHYGLSGVAEARAYLAHPVLGPRLRECCGILLQQQGLAAVEIFGSVDAMKLRSCLTLFMLASPGDAIFREALRKFHDGEPDPLTVDEVARREHA
jgi:uncharacterized protein (DUF1810 family)